MPLPMYRVVLLQFYIELFVVVQSLSCVWLFATPWPASCRASLCLSIFRSLLKLMSFELVMLSNHLILYHSFLFLPWFFPSFGVFSNESAVHISRKRIWQQCRRHRGRKWQISPVLPEKYHGQRSLVGCSPEALKKLDYIWLCLYYMYSLYMTMQSI